MDVLMWNREPVGGPFALVDHTGKPRTRGGLPRQAPADLFRLHLLPGRVSHRPAGDRPGAGPARRGRRDAVQPLFITLDPERDTPQLLADYVPLFHPRLIGLSGDATSIRQAARAYKVYYAKVPTAAGSDYTVDHSGYIYLMDRAGQYLGFFPPGTPPDRMADVIRPLVGEPRD